MLAEHKKPVVALVTAGVEMDVLGLRYDHFTDELRRLVLAVHPRGNVKADVLALKRPEYRRTNFCGLILNSPWNDACACGAEGAHQH